MDPVNNFNFTNAESKEAVTKFIFYENGKNKTIFTSLANKLSYIENKIRSLFGLSVALNLGAEFGMYQHVRATLGKVEEKLNVIREKEKDYEDGKIDVSEVQESILAFDKTTREVAELRRCITGTKVELRFEQEWRPDAYLKMNCDEGLNIYKSHYNSLTSYIKSKKGLKCDELEKFYYKIKNKDQSALLPCQLLSDLKFLTKTKEESDLETIIKTAKKMIEILKDEKKNSNDVEAERLVIKNLLKEADVSLEDVVNIKTLITQSEKKLSECKVASNENVHCLNKLFKFINGLKDDWSTECVNILRPIFNKSSTDERRKQLQTILSQVAQVDESNQILKVLGIFDEPSNAHEKASLSKGPNK